MQTALCNLIERGNLPEDAAGACGITPKTYYEWMQRGRNGENPYSGFRDAVLLAKRSGRVDLVGIIRGAAESDPRHWKAAQVVLERADRSAAVSKRQAHPELPANLSEPEFWARLKAEALEKLALCAEWERSRALPAPAPVLAAAQVIFDAELVDDEKKTA